MKTPKKVQQMNTLTECSNKLYSMGFIENFRVRKGKLVASSDEQSFEANQLKISNFYRFEGNSDPSDNAILYAIETDDGRRGMLVDAYGADADIAIGEFVKQITDIDKKTQKEEK